MELLPFGDLPPYKPRTFVPVGLTVASWDAIAPLFDQLDSALDSCASVDDLESWLLDVSELGITADDIEAYDLPSDKLSSKDVEALKAELSDPRFAEGWWQEQIQMMLSLDKKAEQQSLAKYGLDFVTDTYLPEKLAEIGLGN